MISEYNKEDHYEFVVLFKDGSLDWVDPVVRVEESEDEILITNDYYGSNVYTYSKASISDWVVRRYDKDVSYNPFSQNVKK